MNICNSLKKHSSTKEKLEDFINHNFQEIYDFFYNQPQIDLYQYKKETKEYFKQYFKVIISIDCSNKVNCDFIALMIETCEKLQLVMEFRLFYNHLSKFRYTIGKKLEATYQYITINKFVDYYQKYPIILERLNSAFLDEEESKEVLTVTFINFYLSIVYDFGERNQDDIIRLKGHIFNEYQNKKYSFLDEKLIHIIFNINIDDFRKARNAIINISNDYLYKNGLITCTVNSVINLELSEYSNSLRQIDNPTFDDIRDVSTNYIKNKNIEDQNILHCSLEQGTKILDTQDQLYQYMFSYGKMHKAKLYSSFDKVIHHLNNKTINIIDWGCGQALATSLLIDYIKENQVEINISDIIFIEPSSLALSRGLVHIDILKAYDINIKAINKEIDCLETDDLRFDNDNITVHIFSNILDVEFFKLDKLFLEKISNSQSGLNYFICVSPNINDKRNSRLDMFYRYFDDNFDTELLSERSCNIIHLDKLYKRYEKIFKANI